MYLDDFTRDELSRFANEAYVNNVFPETVAPVSVLDEKRAAIELWHGPTAAFKDMALSIMPRLLSASLKKQGEERVALVLVATSGDTGKAALEGYRDVDGIKIKVFYPVDGVSEVQKLQMVTQAGKNVDVCAIVGNFDDAQSGVKRIFSDPDIASKLDDRGYFLSSANSINWGRLAPQIVYYFWAYLELVRKNSITFGEEIDFCVPTGNFGNILAGYIAKRMGLPICKLICASNENNVLTDFLSTGVYDKNRKFHTTISPSMDILISSNLERLIYFASGSETVCRCMEELSALGKYEVDGATFEIIKRDFVGFSANEEDTCKAVRDYYDNFNYLIDTHTAVAFHCLDRFIEDTGSKRMSVAVSTASPFKFASSVYRALSDCMPPEGYAALTELSDLTGVPISTPLAELDQRVIRFERVRRPADMAADIFEHLDD
jgi:threonine synthase